MSLRIAALPLLVACSLLVPAQANAHPASDTGIQADVQHSLAEARKEVRADLAQARRELDTGNLKVDGNFQFGRHHDAAGKSASQLPTAEITPQGDFLIGGQMQPIDTNQRRQLLAYRGLVVEVAKIGIDIGQKSSEAALDAVGGSWLGLMVGAMTGSLERRVDRVVREQVEPGVRGICRLLPKVRNSQQQLAGSVPQFRPYANLDANDVEQCESDIRREFATR
ncbi:MAG TPA: hypothetical protein PKX50_01385 [Thermomonas sp.]|jgi:hypothetical protein|nr:hypothetical protein [Thermomonas sp.]